MSSLRRHHPSPALPPLEDDDLLSEILLRLPPQPSSLPRASLVCKRWRDIVSDPGFCRRFRRRHRRNPPLLGFFQVDNGFSFVPSLKAPDRVSPERFSLQHEDRDGHFVSFGCRHGLVLVFLGKRLELLVWDPVTGEQHRIAFPPGFDMDEYSISGAVLRSAGDVNHFQVALVGSSERQITQAVAYVYSSESVNDLRFFQLSLIRADGGGIGLLVLSGFSTQFWNRRANSDGVASWVLGRTIGNDQLLHLEAEEMGSQIILGFAEENNVVLLWTIDGLVMLQVESLQFEKVLGTNIITYYHSFESVYTAETSIGGGHDGADLLYT